MNQKEQNLWEYVPLADYAAPQATISRTIKSGIKGIWQRFQQQDTPVHQPAQDLEYLPPSAVEKVAPSSHWSGAVRTLEIAVKNKTGSAEAPSVMMVVGLPGSGTTQILSRLAKSLGWRLIPAPDPRQILTQDLAWLDWTKSANIPWVLPDLGKTYLRHVRGLTLVRKLLDRINSKAAGLGVVGCDSWALSYLRRVLPVSFPEAVVAQAFDDHALGRWLGQRADKGCGQQIRFRQADNGKIVLPADDDAKASAFINQLAARSFGIPGIALEIWRRALKREPDQTAGDQASETEPDDGITIWVEPWEKMPSLVVPSDLGPAAPLLMHSLLLHNGLPRDLAADLLPFSATQTGRTLLALTDAGIVQTHQGELKISARWYPSVRAYLNGEGYLTDQF
ncbi:hypothetical protein DO021_03350 [Desulfobacter hydrogenophilus]|uniref:Uncharacterized protein n=1 Tax=Desulfobacter hydrogenophilus TaxID=2291 RepID=A0A328FG35_9BACT|nr:hypothetical protein [Desulfobacter hydrogenophilus]NDY70687.1 hypothetical protein [Desulfobacter hydrogenophilus]QBH12695.1 hypothetical protein EYB58_07115 [Desulfobacter hydrogenophilus]RAM03339.1 hypothetical protein DO021_03350 [Desulfobacter hydrogenophilus]